MLENEEEEWEGFEDEDVKGEDFVPGVHVCVCECGHVA